MLVIWDEILTGAGRTGPWWAWERSGPAAEPDLMTAGKGIGGGVAIGALFGKPKLMETWSRHVSPSGESPYASTFYAHPVACAGTLAALERLTSDSVQDAKKGVEHAMQAGLAELGRYAPRHVGLMAALDLNAPKRWIEIQEKGLILIPGGHDGGTLSALPAFTMAGPQIAWAFETLGRILK
jgi:acetylornithine/succinyldiaminopimelate/putrescine aminotransferase